MHVGGAVQCVREGVECVCVEGRMCVGGDWNMFCVLEKGRNMYKKGVECVGEEWWNLCVN